MRKLLLISFFTLLNLNAATTMCYKENITDPALSQTTALEGGECLGSKSVEDMQKEGWEINDIKITPSKTSGMNYTYVFKKGGASLADEQSSMSEEELMARIIEKMEMRNKAKKKLQKEEERKAIIARISTFYIENCQQCHGEKGELNAYGVSRPLKDLTLAQLEKGVDKYLFENIGTSTAFLMKPYAQMVTDTQLNDIYLYLESLNPKEEK